MKQVSGSLKLDLAQYTELLAFTQFGSDLDPITKATIDKGARLTELLKQGQYSPLTMPYQVISLYAGKNGFLTEISVEDIKQYEEELHQFIKSQHADIIERIDTNKALDEALDNDIKKALEVFNKQFVLKYEA